jgi:hypothetical protein
MSASLMGWFGYLIYTRAALDDGSPVRVSVLPVPDVVPEAVAEQALNIAVSGWRR